MLRTRRAVTAGLGGEVLVEAVEMVGAKPSQRDVADGGVDVTVDEPRVAVGRGCSDVPALVREPGAGEELADVRRPAAGGCSPGVLAVDAGGDELSVVSVMADGVPASSLLTGEGVEAVVGDDIEAVLALHDVGHADGHRRLRNQPEEPSPARRGGEVQNGSLGSLVRGDGAGRLRPDLGMSKPRMA